jgi:hypothetical protein
LSPEDEPHQHPGGEHLDSAGKRLHARRSDWRAADNEQACNHPQQQH